MNQSLKRELAEIALYMESQGIDLQPYPSIKLTNVLTQPGIYANTGYYDPDKKLIVLYTSNRHMKDILRSYAHELIHHNQNLQGRLIPAMSETSDPKYAQNNKQLRRLEIEAYAKGNMLFRDWTDNKNYN